MAILCPAYDPVFGWYVIVCEPDGPKKRLIVSPLHYYNKLGVSPPVGATFNIDDYLDIPLNDENNDQNNVLNIQNPNSLPILSSDPYDKPLVIKVGPPKSYVESTIEQLKEKYEAEVPKSSLQAKNCPSQYAPIIPEAGVSESSLKATNCPSQYAPIIPEAGVLESSLKATNCLSLYAPIIPEAGVPKSSLKATNCPSQYAPIIPEAGVPKSSLKATNCPSQYAPIIPEAGVPKSSLKATNCPSQYAPIVSEVGSLKSSLNVTSSPLQYAPLIQEVEVPKSSLNVTSMQDSSQHAGLMPDFIIEMCSETNESTFHSASSLVPSVYTPEFSSALYNHYHYQKNLSSFEPPQPSTSNTFQDVYSSGYYTSVLNKNLMSSTYEDYDENDDYNMATAYNDPYGEPHNM